MLATPILEDLPFKQGDDVLAFVNGMGGTPLIELYVVYNELTELLEGTGHHDHAQPGRHLHHVARDGRLLDHAAEARRRADPAVGRAGQDAGLRWGAEPDAVRVDGSVPRLSQGTSMSVGYDDVVRFLRTFASAVAEQKAYLTELDSAIGDADHGINMDRGFQAVLGKLDGAAR